MTVSYTCKEKFAASLTVILCLGLRGLHVVNVIQLVLLFTLVLIVNY